MGGSPVVGDSLFADFVGVGEVGGNNKTARSLYASEVSILRIQAFTTDTPCSSVSVCFTSVKILLTKRKGRTCVFENLLDSLPQASEVLWRY